MGDAHGRQAMSDDDDGAVLHDRRHVALDDLLGLGVEGAGRFVEDQDARVGHQGSGDGNALALTAREVGAAFVDRRIVSMRQVEDELVGAGELRRPDDRLHRDAGVGQRDVFANRSVEQEVFLQDHADLAAQPRCVDEGEVDAVDQHAALGRHVEALDQAGERALARA